METRYNTFKSNENKTWENKLVWRGLYGTSPKPSISMMRFNKETGLMDFNAIDCVDDFYKKAKSIASKYIKWVKSIDNIYTDCEYNDMYNSFIGGLGEFFFTYLLNEVGRILVKNEGKVSIYDFKNVCPLLIGEKDFGIDLTGVVNGKNCVMQVKFWNPYSDEILTTDILQKAYAEGVLNEFINPTEKENVIICWLGDESKISMHLRDNKKLTEHIIFIDKKSLALSADKKECFGFWKTLADKLSNIGL